jgi:hypothetical protein
VTLTDFLDQLFTSGRVKVGPIEPLTASDLRQADDMLAGKEQHDRLDLPGMAPLVSLPAARWAAVMLCRACQLVVYRDVGEPMMREVLGEGCPAGPGASLHYSVDLAFRWLPDVWRLARVVAETDPLLECLAIWAAQWPLSSVGMTEVTPSDLDAIAGNPCLLRLYVDRILARRDWPRLGDPRVAEVARQAIGLFPRLAPEAAEKLKS